MPRCDDNLPVMFQRRVYYRSKKILTLPFWRVYLWSVGMTLSRGHFHLNILFYSALSDDGAILDLHTILSPIHTHPEGLLAIPLSILTLFSEGIITGDLTKGKFSRLETVWLGIVQKRLSEEKFSRREGGGVSRASCPGFCQAYHGERETNIMAICKTS